MILWSDSDRLYKLDIIQSLFCKERIKIFACTWVSVVNVRSSIKSIFGGNRSPVLVLGPLDSALATLSRRFIPITKRTTEWHPVTIPFSRFCYFGVSAPTLNLVWYIEDSLSRLPGCDLVHGHASVLCISAGGVLSNKCWQDLTILVATVKSLFLNLASLVSWPIALVCSMQLENPGTPPICTAVSMYWFFSKYVVRRLDSTAKNILPSTFRRELLGNWVKSSGVKIQHVLSTFLPYGGMLQFIHITFSSSHSFLSSVRHCLYTHLVLGQNSFLLNYYFFDLSKCWLFSIKWSFR